MLELEFIDVIGAGEAPSAPLMGVVDAVQAVRVDGDVVG